MLQMFVEINETASAGLPVNPMEIHSICPQPPITRPMGFIVHQFIWVTDGAGVFEACGEKAVLSKGQGMFTRKTAPHSYCPEDSNLATSWVTFVGGEAILDYYGVGEYMFFECPEFIDKSANELENSCQGASIAMRSAHMSKWMTELLDGILHSKTSITEKINDYLEGNFAQTISLDSIACAFKINKYRLCHLYKSETGITIMNTLKRIRIEKAKKMLENKVILVEQM